MFSPLYFVLCIVLLFLSIGCRALHEFARHDLERICNRKNQEKYFKLIIDSHSRVRFGFEMIRSILHFSIPVVAVYEVWPETVNKGVPLDFVQQIALPILPYFLLYIACRYWIARPLGDMYATRIVYYGFHFFRVLACFAFPLSWIGRFLEVVIQRLAGVQKTEQNEEEDLEEDIRSIVAEGHRDGFIEDEVRVMFDRIMQLDDAQVSTIMTPRTEIQSLSRDANWQEMLDFVNETQLSRIPVFGEDRDDIIGILFSKDLLLHLGPSGTPALNWTEYLHPPVFVPETKQINILLQEFLKSQNHFAIVLDEYGGVSGLVTLEDILEQIVGEIADETDDVPPEEIHLAEDGSAEVLGRVHIDEINTRLGTELSTEGDFETIGGFILTQLGRVPAIGEEIEADGVRLVVEEATARRVEKVRIILSSEDEGEIS
ncbi:MAG: hemolysin family protein [Thermoguttaceae bacterium]|nr:HlyC/CorC family transporter [Thermoguttaceae bacterium]MDO4858802.1 hemolysin family protein [Thermoguttaceae bacterium]